VDAEGVGRSPRAKAVEGRPVGVGEREGARKDFVAEVQRVALHVAEPPTTVALSIEKRIGYLVYLTPSTPN